MQVTKIMNSKFANMGGGNVYLNSTETAFLQGGIVICYATLTYYFFMYK